MSLVRSLATVGGWTLVSRLLGFVRDVLIARTLGTGPAADAFFVAFRLPNLFRALLAEGAFNASFVPLFTKRLEGEGKAPAVRFGAEALAVLLTVTLLLTALAILGMPWLMALMAPGFDQGSGQFDLAVELARVTFPYLVFMCLTALFTGMLNAVGRFSTGAAAPTLLNVVMIVALLGVLPLVGDAPRVLSWAVTFAGLAQFLMLWLAARRAGLLAPLPRPRLTADIRRLLALMGPGLVAAGAMQLNLFVGTLIATLQEGAASLLYYADRIYQLPLALFGIALSVVLLPTLTRTLKTQGEGAAREALNRGLETASFLTLPASVALLVIPLAICRTLFEHGAFTSEDSRQTALALFAYAAGLPAFVIAKVLQPAFYAREDTKTPLKTALAGVACNLLLGIGLFFLLNPYGYGFLGLAAATSSAAWLTAGLLAWRLRRRGLLVMDSRLWRRLPAQGGAALSMGLMLYGLMEGLWPALSSSEEGRFLALAVMVVAGLAAYLLVAFAAGAITRSELKALVPRRRT